MPITNNLRKTLDRPTWEPMCISPLSSAAGSTIITDSRGIDKDVLFVCSAATTGSYLYNVEKDSFVLLPSPAFSNTTIGAGTCGTFSPMGPTGTATAGTTTTITTNLTIPGDLTGYTIRITGGPNAGEERTILNNTQGANSVITVDTAFGTTITTSSTYRLMTGRFYVFISYTTYAAANFRYYDRALGTWNTVPSAQGSLPAAWATDGRLVATPSTTATFESSTATSATGTTLVDSTKGWTASQWINYQVRITGGTGVGQIRTITANNGTSLTVATWTVNPDATSTYVIEGNDNFLYLVGNNATTTYIVTLTENGSTGVVTGTIGTTGARGSTLATGGGANWVCDVSDSRWTGPYVAANGAQNGRFIYTFRGGAASTLARYDITTGTWGSDITYINQAETFTTGTCCDYDVDYIYISKEATGRIFRYNIAANILEPYNTFLYPNSTAVVGDKLFTITIQDGGASLTWIYQWLHTSNVLLRVLDF